MLLENEFLRVEVLPEIGGKISSIMAHATGSGTEPNTGTELLQPPLVPIVPRRPGLPFDQSDASGWDECLPTVAACTLADGTAMQDHGDVWREPWTVLREEREAARMIVAATTLPLVIERGLQLDGPALRLDYRVRNEGAVAVPFIWSAHPLFAVDPGDRIVLPASVRQVLVEGSAGERLGPSGSLIAWPGSMRLDEVLGPEAGVGDKLYAPAPGEGWVALERRSRGVRLEVRFDPNVLPWLGLWICYGGWPEGAEKRGYCVALEPCKAAADSLEKAGGQARTLAPGEEHSWSIELAVRAI